MLIRNYVSLRSFNTFGVEASARYYTELDDLSQLYQLLNHEIFCTQPRLILGGGSNVLFVSDFEGLVVRVLLKGISVEAEDEHHVYLKAMAGENWDDFVTYCVGKNYGGLENLTMIPGNVGASPMQNIGAYGVEIKDTFNSLEAVEIETGILYTFNHADCRFGYRDSYFKQEGENRFIILSVIFRLTKANHKIHIQYGDVKQVLEDAGIQSPSISDVMVAIRQIRQSKLPDPAEIGNGGSFFKNPVLEPELFLQLREQWPAIPAYHDSISGRVKTAAGWLIDQAGWKGFTEGEAGVHPRQALVLVNYGNATGSQILNLAGKIKESVKVKFGIELETEVNIVGNDQ
jgi:UDP-N-acetylmuramate dehydrogenase